MAVAAKEWNEREVKREKEAKKRKAFCVDVGNLAMKEDEGENENEGEEEVFWFDFDGCPQTSDKNDGAVIMLMVDV